MTPAPRSDRTVEQLALAAFAAFATGNANGSFDGFIGLLDADVELWVPASGPFHGRNKGRDQVAEFCRWIAQDQKARSTFHPPYRVTTLGQTSVIEFEDDGEIAGRKVRNRICMSIDIDKDKVVAIREYVGLIG